MTEKANKQRDDTLMEAWDRSDRMLERRVNTVINKQKEGEERLLNLKIKKAEDDQVKKEIARIKQLSSEYNVLRRKRKQEYELEMINERIQSAAARREAVLAQKEKLRQVKARALVKMEQSRTEAREAAF